MSQPYILMNQAQGQSEQFYLAAYIPPLRDGLPIPDENSIRVKQFQKLVFQEKKVVLDDSINAHKFGIDGVVLANSSLQLVNVPNMFLRVDQKTGRMKLCPNGKSSVGFSVRKDKLNYNGQDAWSVCNPEGGDFGFIYPGTLKSNDKFCKTGGTQIFVRTVGKNDASGALPDFP